MQVSFFKLKRSGENFVRSINVPHVFVDPKILNCQVKMALAGPRVVSIAFNWRVANDCSEHELDTLY
jgi:hypothetical protein